MITPSFSPTATERVLPRLALDFTTGVLDPRVTVTRALNTATRVNSSGFIETVNADLPRFDYDPTTLACKGLLIEETRTNLINQSDNFAAASWTANTSTVSPNAAISPDGTQNADRWVSDPGSTSHYLGQSYTSSASISYTFSVWVKSATGSNQTFRLFVQSSVASGNLTASTSWQRFTLTLPSSAAGSFVAGLTRNSSNDPVDLFVYGAQLEAGAFATSYIPTTTTSLTRNADVVTMTGTNFSSWYNASEGAFVVEASTPPSGAYAPMIQIDSGSSANRIAIGQTASGLADYSVVSGGAAQASFQTTTIADSTASIAGVYKTDSFARAVNGGAASADNLGSVPTVNNLKIGSNLTPLYFNRHIKKISFYNQRILNAEATAFSKL